MLLMHGLSYGPALTRNTKERASVCQSDQVGLRPPRVTSHTILTRTIFSCMSFIPNCRAGFISSLNLLAERTPAPFYQSFNQASCRAGLYDPLYCLRGPSMVELTGHDSSAADIMVIYVLLLSWYMICTGTAVSTHTSIYNTADGMYVSMYV